MADNQDPDWGKALGVGFEIAVGVGLGALIGYFADTKLHSAPWGLLVGVLVGVSAGMYLLIREAIRMNKD